LSRNTFVILGLVVTVIGLLLGGYFAIIPCATNLTDAQRLGEPWCGFSRAYALAGLVLASVGVTIILLGGKAKQSESDGTNGSRPELEA
jgi:hypothetical protein